MSDDLTPEAELAEYDDHVAKVAGYALVCMDEHDPRSVFYTPAVSSIMWVTNSWLKPGYEKHVEAVFVKINDPDYERRGEPIPPAPPGTDLVKVRKLMLKRPWDISPDVSEWLIYDVCEKYIR